MIAVRGGRCCDSSDCVVFSAKLLDKPILTDEDLALLESTWLDCEDQT